MFLLAEIILTIFAWRRGWRWLALLPIGIVLAIGFFIGVGIGAAGGSVDDIGGGTIIFDILTIIALIVMVSVKPKSKKVTEENVSEEKKK